MSDFLNKEVGSGGIGYTIAFAVVGIIIIILLFVLVRLAYHVERLSGKKAHTIFKSILIGFAPAIYYGALTFEIDLPITKGLIIGVTIAVVLIVAIWNLSTFGLFGGIVTTLAQCLYGSLITLCVLSVTFIALAAVAIFFFSIMGTGSTGNYSSGRIPSHVRDVNTNESFHVSTGANGMYYVNRYGSDLPIRNSDYSGRYIDSNGNEYV